MATITEPMEHLGCFTESEEPSPLPSRGTIGVGGGAKVGRAYVSSYFLPWVQQSF